MSQNAIQTPTTGTVSGLQNNQDINAALLAILSLLSGASAPTAAGLSAAGSSVSSLAGFPWHDLATNLMKIRDQADSAWIVQGLVDETNKLWVPALRSYLAGLILSNDGTTPNTKIDVSAGICMDDTNTTPMSLAAGLVDFTVNGADGLDAGAIAAGTWYHIFAIGGSGVASKRLASTNLSSPTMPAGYTYKRRLGSVKTDGSAHLLAFLQFGDRFVWKAGIVDVGAATPTSGAQNTITLSVPPCPSGTLVSALVRASIAYAGGVATSLSLYSGLLSTAPAIASLTNAGPAGNNITGEYELESNGASQIASKLTYGTSTTYSIETRGWVDTRGRDA